MTQEPHHRKHLASVLPETPMPLPSGRRPRPYRNDARDPLAEFAPTTPSPDRELGDSNGKIAYFQGAPNNCSTAGKRLLDRLAIALLEGADDGNDEEEILFDLTELGTKDIQFIQHLLGKGRITGEIALTDGVVAEVSSTALTRAWEIVFRGPDGAILEHFLQVDDLPRIIRQAALATPLEFQEPARPDADPAFPLLKMIQFHAWHFEDKRNAVRDPLTLDLLKLEDSATAQTLCEILGRGSIDLSIKIADADNPLSPIVSQRITSTGTRHVWLLEGFDAQGTLLQQAVSIDDIPLALMLASPSSTLLPNAG